MVTLTWLTHDGDVLAVDAKGAGVVLATPQDNAVTPGGMRQERKSETVRLCHNVVSHARLLLYLEGGGCGNNDGSAVSQHTLHHTVPIILAGVLI
jgi:hypothetical protein